MNRRKLNVLQTKFMKKKFRENVEDELKFLKVITNDEYYRVKNVDELQQVLKKRVLSNALVSTKEVNEKIRSTFKKKSMTLYLSHKKTQSNNEYECDVTFKRQLNEIVKIFEKTLSNDAIIQQKCCTIKY